jgi:hypothetical protein
VTYREAFEQFERSYWLEIFKKHGKRVPPIARESGLDRSCIYKRIIPKYNLGYAQPAQRALILRKMKSAALI